MPPVLQALIATSLLTCAVAPTLAAEDDDKWKAQDSWERFSDKQSASASKPSKAKPSSQPTSPLTPVLSKKPAPADAQRSYVLMPAADPPLQQPQAQVETTYQPVGRQPSAYAPGGWGGAGLGMGLGSWGGSYGHGYGNAWGGGYRNGYGWGGGPSFGAFGGAAPSAVMYRPLTKITQTGPSKPAGNYYSPSTVDPTASGNYFASPTGLPKMAPIIQQDAPPKDYWGSNGNPLPDSMRP